MNKELLTQLNQWYEGDEHQKIIDTITNLPSIEINYGLVGQLGRAYNNLGQYDKAIEILLTVAEKGNSDTLWNFRMGYAYYYKNEFEKALPFFEKGFEAGDIDATMFHNWCKDALGIPESDKDSIPNGSGSSNTQKEYAALLKSEKYLSVCFYIEHEKPFEIGQKINKLNELAYMNGYNWEALFNYYLPKYHPSVFENMNTDPEAGMYVAYYEPNTDNEARAEKFIEIIEHLVKNEEVLYELVKNEGSSIEWD